MGILGTFIKGALTGAVGLGVLSWLVSTFSPDKKDEDSEEED